VLLLFVHIHKKEPGKGKENMKLKSAQNPFLKKGTKWGTNAKNHVFSGREK